MIYDPEAHAAVARGERGLSRRTILGLGCIATVTPLVGFVGWHTGGQSGQEKYYPPTEQRIVPLDSETVGLSLNAQKKLRALVPQLGDLIVKYDPDFINIQEATEGDTEYMSKVYEDWHIMRVTTDTRQEGQANLIMTRQKPKDVETLVIGGPGTLETGWRIVKGTFSSVFNSVKSGQTETKEFSEAFQESRASMAVTIDAVDQAGAQVEVRVVNGHISPHLDFKQQHIKENIRFLQDTSQRADIAVFCGDFNEVPGKILPAMNRIGFSAKLTAPTSVNSGDVIDYCFTPYGTVYETTALKNIGSDHRPLLTRITHRAARD